ncbi:MAG TPA: MMPL family transporter [Actinomycetota bacterium]|nr:MMPL family transporter [Actinomycetota bacterium]
MSLTPFLYRIGRGAVRQRWTVIAVWVVVAAGLFVASRVFGTAFIDDFSIPGAEAQAATDRLAERFPDRSGVTATVVFRAREGTLADPDLMSAVKGTLLTIALQPHVVGIDDPTKEGGQAGVSADRTVAFTTVYYRGGISELGRPAADRLAEAVRPARAAGLQVETGGPLVEYTHLPEIRASEIVGVIAAVVVLFVAFGSVVAMGVPIVTALIGLGTSLAIVGLLSHVSDIPTLTPALATMLGLGVGIDYALFIVTRYREGLARGHPVAEAVGRAIATSGQAVLFAGFTVMVSIWGLWVSGVPFIGLIGTASSLAVAIAVVAALTLLPALLGVIGTRIDALGLGWLERRSRVDHQGMWARWARTVARHPWRSLVAGLVVIGVVMAPLSSMRLGFEVGIAGEDSTQARAAALLEEAFGPGINGPLVLVLELADPTDTAAVGAVAEAAAADPNVAAVMAPAASQDGATAIMTIVPRTARADRATADLVTRLRETTLPPIEQATGSTVLVGGATAILIDLADRVAGRLWLLIATVVGLSFVLLMLVFRSVLVPVKAAILNGLSICAAYGAVVAVFQWGWGSESLGVGQTVSIVSFVPMVMFAILFGLSMDYEVFLLSRIREEYLVDRDTVESVAVGIRSTARVITSAALVMIAVFLAFLLSESITVRMVGFGLAVAVLIDATIVRIVLVPATMVLLGHANWWLPRWLERILPRVHIEGEGALPAPIPSEPIRTTEFSHDGSASPACRAEDAGERR